MNKKPAKEYAISTLKGAIGAIPFAGTLINEVAFEARSRLKQERVNEFIEEFAKFVDSKKEEELSLDEIKKEDFGDVFEEIVISTAKTSAKHKLEIFKKILWNQFAKPDFDKELVLRYISITNSLSELQVFMLSKFSLLSDSVLKYKVQILEMEKTLSEAQANLQSETQLSKRGYEHNIKLLEKRIKYIQKGLSHKKRRK